MYNTLMLNKGVKMKYFKAQLNDKIAYRSSKREYTVAMFSILGDDITCRSFNSKPASKSVCLGSTKEDAKILRYGSSHPHYQEALGRKQAYDATEVVAVPVTEVTKQEFDARWVA